MPRRLFAIAAALMVLCFTSGACVQQISIPPRQNESALSRDQQFILACHRLDVGAVASALRDGANVNARFGNADAQLFMDPWSRSWPVGAENWTPLIAVASASDYPPPPRPVRSTIEDMGWASDQKQKIPRERIDERRRTIGEI